MEKTTREFVREFASLKDEAFVVMDRKTPVGVYTPVDEEGKPTAQEYIDQVGKALTVKEFSRYFSKYSGDRVVVTRRGEEIGNWIPKRKDPIEVSVTDFRANLAYYLDLLAMGEQFKVRGVVLGELTSPPQEITVREFKARVSHYLKLLSEGGSVNVRGLILNSESNEQEDN